jgi:hypothetical protein
MSDVVAGVICFVVGCIALVVLVFIGVNYNR